MEIDGKEYLLKENSKKLTLESISFMASLSLSKSYRNITLALPYLLV